MTVIAPTEFKETSGREDIRGKSINKILEYSFENWTDFVDTAENRTMKVSHDKYSYRASRKQDHQDFNNFGSFESAIYAARYGWPEGLARIKKEIDNLGGILPVKEFRKTLEYSIAGPGTVDMGRYLVGHPECVVTWRDREEDVYGNGPIVAITCNLGASWDVTPETLFRRGALIVALVDLLESSDRRCEITILASHARNGHDLRWKTIIKHAHDPLDLERVAFALASGDCYRRLGFSVVEGASEEFREKCGIHQGGGYGSVGEWDLPDTLNIPPANDKTSWSSEYTRIRWLKAELLKQGEDWET